MPNPLVGLFPLTMAALLLTCAAPRHAAADAPRDEDDTRPTLFIIGDSTVRNRTPGQMGWGDPLAERFDPTTIRVENHAIGGRSSRTFQTEGRWDRVLQQARPGDYVLIQFGHNDAGPLDDRHRARGTIRGVGDEAKTIDNPITGQREVVHTYGWYLRKYVRDARGRGMTPILLSYVPRCPRPDNEMQPIEELTSYTLYAKQVAQAEDAPFIDLHGIIWSRYLSMTPGEIKAAYFCDADYTHTNQAGAAFNAQAVADGVGQLEGVDLKRYLRE